MTLFRSLSPRHRRFLAVLTILAVTAVVWVLEFNQRQWRVKNLVTAITASGGMVWVEAPIWRQYVASWRGYVVNRETQVALKGGAFNDAWLRENNDLAVLEIDWLKIDNCPVTTAGLDGIVAQHPIGFLSVANVKNCDEIAALLSGKRTLRCASFDGTDLSDVGFRQLPLEGLAVVSVHGTRVTPTGLLELKRCRRLGQLWLDGGQFDERVADLLRVQGTVSTLFLKGEEITDEHLSLIQGMSVRYVRLTDTSVTQQGVAALQKLLPKCRIRVHSTDRAGPMESSED